MNKKFKNHLLIIFGVLLIFTGFIMLSYSYFLVKIDNAYNTINLELYGNNIPKNVSDKNDVLKNDDIKLENDNLAYDDVSSNKTDNNKNVSERYDYIGYVEIPDINLKKGFLDINSKYNNIKYNVQVISPSQYPDVSNGNFILAAHSGNASISYFKNLYKLSIGNIVNVYYDGYLYKYKISNIYEQYKYNAINIYRDGNINTLTLVTCTKENKQNQTIYICDLIEKIKM